MLASCRAEWGNRLLSEVSVEYQVRVERVDEPRALAVVKRRARAVEMSRVVVECCGLVWNALKAAGVKGAGRHVSVYWDEVVNLEVGVEMDGAFSGVGEVVASALPMGVVVSTVHFGPYQRLGEAHAAVKAWCTKNGYELSGVRWEIYGHWIEEWNKDASKIRTDVGWQ